MPSAGSPPVEYAGTKCKREIRTAQLDVGGSLVERQPARYPHFHDLGKLTRTAEAKPRSHVTCEAKLPRFRCNHREDGGADIRGVNARLL